MLKLPLHYYDDAGRVLPPRAWWWCMAFLCRSLIIFVGAMTLRDKSTSLLSVFYPHRHDLWVGLVVSALALLAIIITGLRYRYWTRETVWPLTCVPLCCLAAVLLDIGWQMRILSSGHWQFNIVVGVQVVILGTILGYFLRSSHLRILVDDWRHKT